MTRYVYCWLMSHEQETDFCQMCNLREKAHLQKEYSPSGDPGLITKDTYYLTNIDGMFRRQYEIKA